MDDPPTNSPSAANIENPDAQAEPQLPEKSEPIEPLEPIEPVEFAGPVEPLNPVVKGTTVEKSKSPIPRTSAQSRNGMNGPLYMQASHNRIIIRRVRRKDGGIMRGLARWLLDNQTGMLRPIYEIALCPDHFDPRKWSSSNKQHCSRFLFQHHCLDLPCPLSPPESATIHPEVLHPFVLQSRLGTVQNRL